MNTRLLTRPVTQWPRHGSSHIWIIRRSETSAWSTHTLADGLKERFLHSCVEGETMKMAAEGFEARETLPPLMSLNFIGRFGRITVRPNRRFHVDPSTSQKASLMDVIPLQGLADESEPMRSDVKPEDGNR
jgi:hypothetical protein